MTAPEFTAIVQHLRMQIADSRGTMVEVATAEAA